MIVLGIETSCDETAAAIVDDERRIRASLVHSQLDDHRPHGGVVPEIAARAHLATLGPLIRRTLAEAGMSFEGLDAVAATAGPGLIGGLAVGTMTAKAIAVARGLPYLAVNHLEGHALTARLTDDVAFPYLLLLVSGGHTQLLAVEGVGRYRRLGTTIDDAAGEAFDKVAKLLALGFPGGPAIERAAMAGDPRRFALPRPMQGRAEPDFSFSGLKTAVRRALETRGRPPTPAEIADLAAGFQAAATDSLTDRTRRAIALAGPTMTALVAAGGVAANRLLRTRLQALAAERGLAFVAPPLALCSDNAAMIAWAGIERLRLGFIDGLDVSPRPRWPLDAEAPARPGAGVKA